MITLAKIDKLYPNAAKHLLHKLFEKQMWKKRRVAFEDEFLNGRVMISIQDFVNGDRYATSKKKLIEFSEKEIIDTLGGMGICFDIMPGPKWYEFSKSVFLTKLNNALKQIEHKCIYNHSHTKTNK